MQKNDKIKLNSYLAPLSFFMELGYGCEIDFLIGVFYIPNNILFL